MHVSIMIVEFDSMHNAFIKFDVDSKTHCRVKSLMSLVLDACGAKMSCMRQDHGRNANGITTSLQFSCIYFA